MSVRFGLMRGPDVAVVGNDLRPPAVRNFLAYTLRRLGTGHVDIYRPGRVWRAWTASANEPDAGSAAEAAAVAEVT